MYPFHAIKLGNLLISKIISLSVALNSVLMRVNICKIGIGRDCDTFLDKSCSFFWHKPYFFVNETTAWIKK